jgi:glycosyltransferase involved in cell wall biosynthesis
MDHVFRLDTTIRYVVLLSAREPSWDSYPNVEQRILTGNRFAVRIQLQRRLPVWTRQEEAGLVHFTKNLGVFGFSCPSVVTVHDLTTLLFPEQFTWIDVAYWRLIEPLTVRWATQVVTVSHDAADDVARFYGVSRKEIEVIHWAAHPRFKPINDPKPLATLRRRYDLPLPPRKLVLFLGNLAKKKNLPTLLRAFARLLDEQAEPLDLVVVGRHYPQSNDEKSFPLMYELGLEERVHFVGSVPDEDLPLFYNMASVYVLPSLHEGFGIPCLEAMACGTPVIATTGGSLPEVVGDAGWILQDPMDALALCTGLRHLLYDKEMRERLIRKGYERAKTFSWDRSAKKMLDVYRSVLEGRE